MTADENTATFRRWFEEGWSQGNVDLADEMYSPDYVTHSVGPDLPPTLDGLKMLESVVAEGDRMAGRFTVRGTHSGPLFGIPPTGVQAEVGAMVIARFDEAGMWVEDWARFDQLGLLTQLGVIPAPAAA
jgi:predicted ester cyclase